jgi:hypothetical protein
VIEEEARAGAAGNNNVKIAIRNAITKRYGRSLSPCLWTLIVRTSQKLNLLL